MASLFACLSLTLRCALASGPNLGNCLSNGPCSYLTSALDYFADSSEHGSHLVPAPKLPIPDRAGRLPHAGAAFSGLRPPIVGLGQHRDSIPG